jgi:diacylglycerol kinase family enzyme
MRLSRRFETLTRFFRWRTPFLFTLGGIIAMFDREVREQRYSVLIDGEAADGCYASINIANGPCYGGDKSAVTGALPDDGVLDMLLAKSCTAARLLRLLPSYLRGDYHKYPDSFRYRRVRRVEISSETPILVNLDGELFFDDSLTVEVMPGAIDFVAVDGLAYKRREGAHEPQ